MQSIRSRFGFVVLTVLLLTACSGDNNTEQDTGEADAGRDVGTNGTDVSSPDIGGDSAQDMPVAPSGNAGLTFVPMLGSDFGAQFVAGVQPFIPEDTSSDRGSLLILLCALDDSDCESPAVRVVLNDNAAEWEMGAPLQGSFGPTVTVNDLAAGTWNLMVVYDSLDSQRRGYGWDDAFETQETRWGGIVSETDMMLSDAAPTLGSNPPPVAVEVTLVDGAVLDLGDLTLSHYHERAISRVPSSETGFLVVGNRTNNALRLVDLSSYSVEEVAAGRYDFPLTDGVNPVDGDICNVIRGPGKTVYVLFDSTTSRTFAGYAVQWDVSTRTQVANVVSFPLGGAEAGPCRGMWHTEGGRDYLFAVASGGSNDGSKRGFWHADVTDLATAGVDATLMTSADSTFFNEPLENVAAFGNKLYIGSSTVRFAECPGVSCAFEATFDATGAPTMTVETNGDFRVHQAGALRADVFNPALASQTISCADVEQGVATFGLKTVKFKKTNQDLLLFGNCHSIDMMDLATGAFLDFDSVEPGIQGLNAALFGGGFYGFTLSPDGDTLWTVSANKSRIMHTVKGNDPVGDLGDRRITVDRHALLPIDLSAAASGSLPEVSATFSNTNRDAFAGAPADGINDLATPEIDPGIDVRGLFLKAYYMFWNRSLSGSLPNPFPTGPSLAVANETVWMRGAGVGMSSALGAGANLSVFDLTAQRLVLWAPQGAEFYSPFLGLQQHVFGFDLTPGVEDSIATAGILYVP